MKYLVQYNDFYLPLWSKEAKTYLNEADESKRAEILQSFIKDYNFLSHLYYSRLFIGFYPDMKSSKCAIKKAQRETKVKTSNFDGSRCLLVRFCDVFECLPEYQTKMIFTTYEAENELIKRGLHA